MLETGQLSPEGLTEEVCFHPGALHQDFLTVEHLEEQHLESAEGYRVQRTEMYPIMCSLLGNMLIAGVQFGSGVLCLKIMVYSIPLLICSAASVL